MKAAFLKGHGGNEVVQVGERPMPARPTGHVRIRMHAATVNRVDLYMRDSAAGISHTLPQIMGLDGAGVIEDLDADEIRFSVGQRVVVHPGITCRQCEFCSRGEDVLCTQMRLLGEHRDGTFAHFLSVPIQNVFAVPKHLNFAQAAALGVNHLTAWRMLTTQAQLRPNETVLIFGVGGGVSLAALQLAKYLGSRVIVTSRDEQKLVKALRLGADQTINSETQDITKTVMQATQGRGVDVVIENVGATVWSAAMKSLVRGGRLVTCGATTGDQPPADLRRIFIRQLKILGSTLGTLHEFQTLLAFVERTKLQPIIDSEYTLDNVHAALNRLESGTQFGKVVLKIA